MILRAYYSENTDAIKESGIVNGDGRISCAYGTLFDKTANTRESDRSCT